MSTALYPSHERHAHPRHAGDTSHGLLSGRLGRNALLLGAVSLAVGYADQSHRYHERVAAKQEAALQGSTSISTAKYLFGPGTKLHSVPSMYGAKFGFTLKDSETRTLKPNEVLAMDQPLIQEDATGHIWVGASPRDETEGLPLEARAKRTLWADTNSLMAPINDGQMKIIDETRGDDVGSISVYVNEDGQIIAGRRPVTSAASHHVVKHSQVIPGAATFIDRQVK